MAAEIILEGGEREGLIGMDGWMDGAFHRLGRPVRVAVGGRCLEFFNVTARRTVNRESAGVKAMF